MSGDSNSGSKGAMAEINVTPLVDVMLVLVIIFIITAPVLTHKIRVDLPQPNKNTTPPKNPPTPIKLRIKPGGVLIMNQQRMTLSQIKLQLKVLGKKAKDKQPEVQINADDNAQYKTVAKVLAAAKDANMQKIGFVNQ